MIFFFFLISVAFGFTERSLFNEWKLKYNKSYESPREEKIHYSNFLASLQRIQKRAPSINGAIYGLTKFSDLSVGEFKSKILMKKKKLFQPEIIEDLRKIERFLVFQMSMIGEILEK